MLGEPLAPQIHSLLTGIDAPAARCALETAILDLVGRRSAQPLWSLLGAVRPASVPLAGLISSPEPAQARILAGRLVARGITTAKVKIGHAQQAPALRVERALRVATAVRDAGIEHLRFDANRTLPAATLARTLQALAASNPELVEEASPPQALLALPQVPVPLALDETLQASDAKAWIDRFASRHLLRAVVLKPMVLGGVLNALALAVHAREHGVRAIASHLFDGPIARCAAAHLALSLPPAPGSERLASGLDRHPGLAAWPDVDSGLFTEHAVVPGSRPGLGLRGEDLL